MSAEALPLSFVDTNVLVYAVASDDDRRSAVAQNLLREQDAKGSLGVGNPGLAGRHLPPDRPLRGPRHLKRNPVPARKGPLRPHPSALNRN